MRIRRRVAMALLFAGITLSGGQLVLAEGERLDEGDNRPDYRGPYQYPRESSTSYPSGAYPYPYAIPPCVQPGCQGAYGDTYYEHNRDGTGYYGQGVPDSAGDASEHQWRTPYRLRREAQGDDHHHHQHRRR